jgi:hypothetical protein
VKGNIKMKCKFWIWTFFLWAAPALGQGDDGQVSSGASPREPETITVVVRHRVVASFSDTLEVAWGTGEQYWIGDTEFSLEVDRFVADFGINEKGEIIERGSEPCNPACQYIIYKDDVEENRGWAFFGTGAPHFRRESILAVDMVSFPWQGKTLTKPLPRKDN